MNLKEPQSSWLIFRALWLCVKSCGWLSNVRDCVKNIVVDSKSFEAVSRCCGWSSDFCDCVKNVVVNIKILWLVGKSDNFTSHSFGCQKKLWLGGWFVFRYKTLWVGLRFLWLSNRGGPRKSKTWSLEMSLLTKNAEIQTSYCLKKCCSSTTILRLSLKCLWLTITFL